MYNVALFFHLLGAFVFLAGIAIAGTGFETARRRERPAEIALLLGLTRLGVALVGLGALLAGSFGLWLVHLGHWGYGSAWVDAGIALFVAALALGAIGGQQPKRARLLATALAGQRDDPTEELRALLDDRIALAANYLSVVIVLAIVALMVFKP
jgi:uncharacterized membrane protein